MLPSNKLESLPAELQLALLELLPTITTLSALVHASPILHATYLTHREAILTKLTLQEFRIRTPPLNISEILKPAAFCHLVTKTEALDRDLEPALKACQAQQAQSNRAASVKLSVEQCIALRTLRFYYSFQIEEEPSPDGNLVAYNDKVSYNEFNNRSCELFVHIFVLGRYTPREICGVRRYRGLGMEGLGTRTRALIDSQFSRTGRLWTRRWRGV